MRTPAADARRWKVRKGQKMKWVTRSHAHVEKVACPWLITRFVDSDAEFLFVPANQVQKVVEETGAISFDVRGAQLGHQNGKCTFETIIERYELTDRALQRLAQIVHSTEMPTGDAIAPGLSAIATGYSLRFPQDLDNLDQQFEVYDCLYLWCQMEVAKLPPEPRIRPAPSITV
jgi:hypothetical protein